MVYWSVPKSCVALSVALRLSRHHIHFGKCFSCHSSLQTSTKSNVGTTTVLAKPVGSVISPVNNWSLPKEPVFVKKQPSVLPSDTASMDWAPEHVEWKQLPSLYLKLSKYRLSALVVLTTLSGAVMAPVAFDLPLLFWTSLGTGLCSASANTFNQWIEVPFDCQMSRTKNRVFVRGLLSPTHGFTFGVITGLLGVSLLLTQVNALTAAIGASNILFYTLVYTPLKRISIVNTWVGSIVGALPPLMGWTACTGSIGSGGLLMAAILYAWQFPHFNALSWNLRGDYSRAGYQMMAVTDPALCRRVALRYCLATIPICTLIPYCGLTTWWFAFDSLLVNLILCYKGWQFYSNPTSQTSRRLFYFTLFHLPLVMALLFLNKNSKDKECDERTSL